MTPLEWPFFDGRHRSLTTTFTAWAATELVAFEHGEGNDGTAARKIFQALGRDGWLAQTLPLTTPVDLRSVCVMREICARISALADVGLSEPWLAALPINMAGSSAMKDRYLHEYLAGRMLPAFALSEPEAGSDVSAIQ